MRSRKRIGKGIVLFHLMYAGSLWSTILHIYVSNCGGFGMRRGERIPFGLWWPAILELRPGERGGKVLWGWMAWVLRGSVSVRLRSGDRMDD